LSIPLSSSAPYFPRSPVFFLHTVLSYFLRLIVHYFNLFSLNLYLSVHVT
jgi:hypothetical protein